ncbi:MAG: hypothetical protein WKF60_11325, partial [Ilumatobacter sp.]
MIACVYCSGEHQRPAEVKQCWAEHDGAPDEAVSGPAPVERSATGPVPPAVAIAARRGPRHLGRNVVVSPGGPAPDDWADAERIAIDRSVLDAPTMALAALRGGGADRVSMVIELSVEFDG